MSKQASKTAIGAFVVGAVIMAVAAVIIFGSGKFFTTTQSYVAYFSGSVKGLRIGAPVVFRGVRIGRVTEILIYSDYRDLSISIPVLFQVNEDTFRYIGTIAQKENQYLEDLIQKGLRAQLQMQSLVTGQLMINIDFHPDSPLELKARPEIKLGKDIIEIPTVKTPFQKIEKTFQEIPIEELAKSVKNTLEGIERLVTSPQIPESLKYLRETLESFSKLARRLDEKIDPLFVDVNQTLKDARQLLQNIDRQVDPLAGSLKRTSDDARRLVNNVNRQVEPLQADLAKTAGTLRATLEAAQKTVDSIDQMVSDDSEFRFQMDIMLREMALAARSIRAFANYLERHPDALLRGKIKREGNK
jgi:paraquat-inducible protein B